MALVLHYHPLSSFCQKVVMAFYENGTPFEPKFLDLQNEQVRADFNKLWPMGKMPVLRDEERDWTVPESTIIIEYIDQHYRGKTPLVPADRDLARRTRMMDRFFDLYVELPMQKAMGDRLRPVDQRDPYGVEQAKSTLKAAYAMIEADMANNTWAMGDVFTMADCAAAPGLFYANIVEPFKGQFPQTTRYFERLEARPSFARVLKEAEPYLQFIPK